MINVSSLLAHGITNIQEINAQPLVKDRRFRNNSVNPAGARAIRQLAKKGVTQAEIASIFSMSQPGISKIIREHSWDEDGGKAS